MWRTRRSGARPWRRPVFAIGAATFVISCDAPAATPPNSTRPSAPSASASAGGSASGGSSSVPAGLVWRRLTGAPSERTEVAAAAVGARIYVVGGFARNGATLGVVEVLDTATGRWERGRDVPVPVNHAMAATAGGTVYVFGGYRADGTPSPTAFRADGDDWRPVADLPEGRAAGTAVSVAGRVYLAGGIAPGGRLADRMLVYDVTGDRWTTAPGPPTRREHLGGAAFDGQVYTVGGRAAGQGNMS